MEHFNMEDFAGGKLSAKINKSIMKVSENVMDPNTDAEKVRKIIVTISFRPSSERSYVATSVETEETLAPEIGAVTALNMGKDIRTGQVECVEIMNQIPGQMSIKDVEETEETATEEEPAAVAGNDVP